MSAQIKVMRSMGAGLVALALVPWLGIAPAAATSGGNGSHGSAINAGGKSDGKSAAKSDKAATKSHGKSEAKGDDRRTGNQKVTLCHRTNSNHNPYVRITVSINSVIKDAGHDGHDGPVYAAGMKAAHQKWGDIIPAFSYAGGSYPGKNWGAGAAIFAAGCAVETGGGHTTEPPMVTVTATPSSGGGGSHQKVTLCHRTNSETNPYVRITVSINSVVKGAGHDGHNGPVFAAGMKAAHQKWGDIIPSFTYTTKTGSAASYGGKNWPSGRAIFDAGCAVSLPTTTTSSSPSGSPTDTVSPTDSSSPSPSGTQTVTTTVTGPNGTATVTQTVTGSTSVLPTKIGNDDDTGVLGGRSGVLPHTGLDLPVGTLLALSFLLVLAGGSLLLLPGRLDTERNRRH
jgi:hypothetical protein